MPYDGRVAWTANNSEGYPSPVALGVDTVVMTVRNGKLLVLATRLPGQTKSLPGTFVRPDETPHDAAARALRVKTGVGDLYLEQLGAFAAPGRDPRGWIPAIAYLALVPVGTEPKAEDASWVSARGRHQWAYDHREILAAACDRVKGKLWWSNLAVGFLPGDFTLSDARRVYEAVASSRYDAATFARDLKSTGLIEPTGERRREGPGRPAALYRYKSHDLTWGAGRRKRVS